MELQWGGFGAMGFEGLDPSEKKLQFAPALLVIMFLLLTIPHCSPELQNARP